MGRNTVQDDEYDDEGESRLPDDDYLENDEVSGLTDLEEGGVVMADFGPDMGDDFDSEPITRATSTRTRKPKKAGRAGKPGKPGKNVAREKTAGHVRKKGVPKVARKATKRVVKKTVNKTRRVATKKSGDAKVTRKVGKKK